MAIGTSPAIGPWTSYIRDPASRRRAFEILSSNPFVNSGFVAGTARAFLHYFRAADRLLSTSLKGVDYWGDQVAMNYYIHTTPDPGGRSPTAGITASSSATRAPTGSAPTAASRAATAPLCQVVHGNGRTLDRWAMAYV